MSKKIAIMQPYLFPYIGYFQLIKAVDTFVLLDDVHYIQRGWINRNRLLVNGSASLFTVPLQKASRNKLIRDTEISTDGGWKSKLLKTVSFSYRHAPYYDHVFPLIEECLHSNESSISELARFSLEKILSYLDIQRHVVPGSGVYSNRYLKGQNKIINICLQEKAGHYINPCGGSGLYDKEVFARHGLELSFLKPGFTSYRQRSEYFIPGLSVIDVLMYNSPEKIDSLTDNYRLESAYINHSKALSDEVS